MYMYVLLIHSLSIPDTFTSSFLIHSPDLFSSFHILTPDPFSLSIHILHILIPDPFSWSVLIHSHPHSWYIFLIYSHLFTSSFLIHSHPYCRPDIQAWDLHTLLIKPVQRIVKYPLLLGKLLEATPVDHPDHKLLMSAAHSASQVAQDINEIKRRKDLRMFMWLYKQYMFSMSTRNIYIDKTILYQQVVGKKTLYTYIHVPTYMYLLYMYIYILTYHTYIHTLTYLPTIQTYTHIHTYIHTCIYVHVHTCT